jgi:putative oxidoreductase
MFFDIGIFLLRVVLGFMFIGHGGQKLFGWFGGSGIEGTTASMAKLGLRPAGLWAVVAALSEFGGGLLLLLGFLSPVGSLGIIAAMIEAIIDVHWKKGFWNTKGGYEFNLINIAAALAIALTGPGRISLDALFGTVLPEPLTLLLGLLLVLVGVVLSQLRRSHSASPAA